MTYRDTPCESEQKPAAVGFQPVSQNPLAGLTVSNINSTNLLRDVEFTQTREAWVKLLEVYLTTSVLCGNDVIQRLESLTNLHDEDIAELVQFLRPYIESQSDTAEGRALSTLLQEEPLDALGYLSRQMTELQPQQHPSVDEVCTQLCNPRQRGYLVRGAC